MKSKLGRPKTARAGWAALAWGWVACGAPATLPDAGELSALNDAEALAGADASLPPEPPEPDPAAASAAAGGNVAPVVVRRCSDPTKLSGCFTEVPSGRFLRGAQRENPRSPGFDPEATAEESPVATVEVRGFWMQATEAPAWMYRECLALGGCPKGEDGLTPDTAGSTELPVVNLTWREAEALCRWLGGRLPTETEWEYAAKEGDDRRFTWGEVPRCPTDVPAEEERVSEVRNQRIRQCDDVVARLFHEVDHEQLDVAGYVLPAWSEEQMASACRTARAAADPVQAFMAEVHAALAAWPTRTVDVSCVQSAPAEVGHTRAGHPWSLYGMSGNVFEWVADGYAGGAYPADPPPASVADQPSDPAGRRGIRGGSYLAAHAREWRTTARAGMVPTLRAADVGVRCVREAAP